MGFQAIQGGGYNVGNSLGNGNRWTLDNDVGSTGGTGASCNIVIPLAIVWCQLILNTFDILLMLV